MQRSLPKSIIGSIVNCQYDFVKLHIIHKICRGLKINIQGLFNPICLTMTIWNRKTSGALPKVSSLREIGTVIYMNKAGCFYEKTTGYYYFLVSVCLLVLPDEVETLHIKEKLRGVVVSIVRICRRSNVSYGPIE